MANPPIVVGPFDNVPAPGSPIRSPWPQEITRYVVDDATRQILTGTPMLTVAARNAWSVPWKVAGTLTTTTDGAGLVAVPYGFTTTGGVLGWSAASGDTSAWWGYAARQGVTAGALTIMCLHHDGNPWPNRAVRVDYEITGWQQIP